MQVGGLGDVVTALGRAVKEQGHMVEVILPRYDFFLHSPVLQVGRRTRRAGQHVPLCSRHSTGSPLLYHRALGLTCATTSCKPQVTCEVLTLSCASTLYALARLRCVSPGHTYVTATNQPTQRCMRAAVSYTKTNIPVGRGSS